MKSVSPTSLAVFTTAIQKEVTKKLSSTASRNSRQQQDTLDGFSLKHFQKPFNFQLLFHSLLHFKASTLFECDIALWFFAHETGDTWKCQKSANAFFFSRCCLFSTESQKQFSVNYQRIPSIFCSICAID